MLSLLKIRNFALIDELSVEFDEGLNLLTGETGSGKSIIVDSLSTLTGDRVYSDLIKEGEDNAEIEGIFEVDLNERLRADLVNGGLEPGDDKTLELIVRRELSSTGRNRVYVNNRLVTQGFLKLIGSYLAEIHGQGEQTTLFSPAAHLEILDEFAGVSEVRTAILADHRELISVKRETESLKQDEAAKLQLIDILQFQVDEIHRAKIEPGEDEVLEEEKRRLSNVGELSELSGEAYALLYENDESVVGNLQQVIGRIKNLAEFDRQFAEFSEGLESSNAILEDLAFTLRDYASSLDFSPGRLEEIENRLAEISRLKRKYGGSIEAVLAHLYDAETRLRNIETAGEREEALISRAAELRKEYLKKACDLHAARVKGADQFSKLIEKDLKSVALEKARFLVRLDSPEPSDLEGSRSDEYFTSKGYDRIEFLFSANPGESPKPLSKVASGGETSRLMLILRTAVKSFDGGKAAIFDEIDAGIGGRVAEAVGLKLKELSKNRQVLCVTHQPQVASLADSHFVVEKETDGRRTRVSIQKLEGAEKIAEIARMLAGETISDTAREHAREMLKAAR